MRQRQRHTAVLAALLGLVSVLTAPACHDRRSSAVTALTLSADLSHAGSPRQLRVTAHTDRGELFPAVLRPEVPGAPLTSPQVFRVLLDDRWAGLRARVLVEGTAQDGRVALGAVAVTVQRGTEVQAAVTVSTSNLLADGGLGCEGCAGCCEDGACRFDTSAGACGKNGEACIVCDALRSDSCAADGSCACGALDPCGDGERCAGGTCVCDPAACQGCCSGGRCLKSDGGLAVCGHTAAACAACSNIATDHCDPAGLCLCGAGLPCLTGQRCVGGQCVCDATTCAGCCQGNICRSGKDPGYCGSGGIACDPCTKCTAGGKCNPAPACPLGCVSGSQCVTPPTAAKCGTAAAPCVACTGTTDTCTLAGACACGTGPACAAGQRCSGGQCICDADSCLSGCCQGNLCNLVRSAGACGTGGGACVSCDARSADGCGPAGECTCGNGPACSDGQRCSGGACICDADSCAGGCCQGNACWRPGDVHHCRAEGAAACSACPGDTADRCGTDAACACGTGAPCADGQRCVSGVCVE